MSQFPNNFGSEPPVMSPPQYAGDLVKPPSSWPTVIGVILIVIGSLGILTNVCGSAMTALMPILTSQAAQSTGQTDSIMQAQVDMTQKYLVFILANAGVLLVLGIMMVVAGIGLLKRRQSGVKWARIWAVLRILWSLPASYFSYVMTIDMFQAMEQASADSSQPMPAGFSNWMQALGVIGVVIGIAMACLIPIFILIWFGVGKIRAETSEWR